MPLIDKEKKAVKELAEKEKGGPLPLGKRRGAARSPALDAPLALALAPGGKTPRPRGRRPLTERDKVYIAGKKRILRRTDEVVIASMNSWVLTECTGWSKDGWVSLKLLLLKRAKKNVWYLGFNKRRMARNRDKEILELNFPDIFNWVVNSVENYLNRGTKKAI